VKPDGDKLVIAIVVILVLVGCCACAGVIWTVTGEITNDDMGSLLGMAAVGFMILLMLGGMVASFIHAHWLR
jgi:MFS family permease